jgi:hypothetical protein
MYRIENKVIFKMGVLGKYVYDSFILAGQRVWV